MAALDDNDSDSELDAEKPLLPARIIPSTYTAEGDLGGGGIPYGWTFETLIGKGTIRERLQRDDSALIKAALRDPHARAAVERREGRRPSRVSDDEWETRLRSRFVRMFINFEFLSTRKRVAVFAFADDVLAAHNGDAVHHLGHLQQRLLRQVGAEGHVPQQVHLLHVLLVLLHDLYQLFLRQLLFLLRLGLRR